MHLLLPGEAPVGDGEEAFDLQQTPGDVLVLSFADTELALLNTIVAVSPCDGPSVRLTDMKFLRHPMSVDLYTEQTAAQARFIIVRALGGAGYWSYGLERLGAVARGAGIPLAVLPGDTKPDPALLDYGTVDADVAERLHGYFNAGGAANLTAALAFAFSRIGLAEAPAPASPLPAFGLYWPDAAATLNEVLTAQQACPRRAGLVFYRALLQSGDTAPVDAAIAALNTAGVAAIPLFVSSLKSPADGAFVAETFTNATPDVVVNMTAFAVSNAGGVHGGTALDSAGVPVIQAVLAAQPRETWVGSQRGLAPRDLAMHVVLPEVDGRIHGPAIAFKAPGVRDARTQYAPVRLTPEPERVERLAQLARRWADLGATSPQERRVGLVFANYPNRDGRLANGVGLDTPASAARMIEALRASGFATEGAPEDARALMDVLLVGPTNAKRGAGGETLTVDAYESQFATLPQALREAVIARWGAAQTDPFVVDARFQLPVTRFGNLALLVQPARGYNIDPKETYHSPDLVPPHGYLAAYFWLREAFGAHAVVHLGKHGTLEWLPGKATALSESCYPDAVLGALPNIYPFIVNDPGEGAQAKRRTGAVIIDHMTPPLARAESHGAGAALEHLLDEFAQAEAMDPARAQRLKTEIARAVQQDGFDRDIGIAVEKGEIDPADLIALDSHLCDLKELQIRDGLHVLGQSPEGPARTAHLVALARGPRGEAPGEASLLRALADDLGLYGFDPLDCVFGEPWMGAKPDALTGDTPWRTNGDTVERLEALASRIMAGEVTPDDWAATGAVLGEVANRLVPALDACGASETRQTLAALNGRFVPPGPAGAPTRGRPDVLPTGRNFYAVDVRAVPSRTAWELGKASAERLMARHFQDHGEWLTAIALSAWGTSNMRTGGDDIAQALALIGAAPVWEATSGRVTGFQVTPLSDLGRPRVDVTLRISGFFRDAFPQLVQLFDSAVAAVAALDEPTDANPIAAAVADRRAALIAAGAGETDAARQARYRIFGAKPGAYGAGLQTLIDENLWEDRADFAEAFLVWGGYAYGAGVEGTGARSDLEDRLARVDAVVHNQDNREHDLLDSDDYYQFEGGLAATVETLKGTAPVSYHMDHSRPERPLVRTLSEEIGLIVRGRAANPKWIEGVMRHGYKGAFEMAATVDYLTAFAATTQAVADHHFDQVYDAYLADDDVCAFIRRENPAALAEMAARLRDAIDMDLWTPRRNSALSHLRALAGAAPQTDRKAAS